ncbi:MAG TPA: hypothetical protein VJY62_20120 [Bacteroidia bacterium]|nr:hypothetical protein [Bacteroidia bacterium]
MKPKWLLTAATLLAPLFSAAQETWGISNSNFAGNMGIFLNPSSIVLAPYKNEFNLLSGDLFIDNNYLFLRKKSKALLKSIKGETVESERFGDYYTPSPGKKAYGSLYVMGPAYIRNKNKYAWGVHLAVKSAMSARNVPYHLAKFMYDGFDFAPQHGINYTAGPFKAAGMGWGEIGATYARVLKRDRSDNHIIKAGITLNFLVGSYGIYVNSQYVDYTVPNAQLLVVNKINAQYGHSSPIDGDQVVNDLLKVRGFGGSATVGFTYINNYNAAGYDCYSNADQEKKYNYRLGLSFVDLGYIRFKSKGTRAFDFTDNSTYWPGIDTTKFFNLYAFDTLLSTKFYGNPTASQRDKAFSVYLPSAASLQLDFCLAPKYYLNASVMQGVPVSAISVHRANQAAVSIRYETRRSEIAMPLTFFEYSKPHLGLAVRYGFLVLGTDRLGTYLGLWDATGLDFFFGIKFSSCANEKGKSRRKSKTGCDI